MDFTDEKNKTDQKIKKIWARAERKKWRALAERKKKSGWI